MIMGGEESEKGRLRETENGKRRQRDKWRVRE
jgi:hypothetical protein